MDAFYLSEAADTVIHNLLPVFSDILNTTLCFLSTSLAAPSRSHLLNPFCPLPGSARSSDSPH